MKFLSLQSFGENLSLDLVLGLIFNFLLNLLEGNS